MWENRKGKSTRIHELSYSLPGKENDSHANNEFSQEKRMLQAELRALFQYLQGVRKVILLISSALLGPSCISSSKPGAPNTEKIFEGRP